MENKTKTRAIIVIGLVIIAITYFYSQGWFATVIPYFEKVIKVF
jgi:uncharacterized membrane protein